jgi:glutaredoxin
MPPVIDIELLALNLSRCTHCVGTLDHIEKAIYIIRPVLEVMEAQVNVRKIVIESEEQARHYQFSISPTIRINGEGIAFETLESKCESCTDLCGYDEGTSCCVWRYQGEEYTEAPVGLWYKMHGHG